MALLKHNKIVSALKLLRSAYGSYKIELVILTVISFLSGFFEALGVNAAIPLFSLITGENIPATDRISRFITDGLTALGIGTSIVVLLLFIALLFILKFLFLLLFQYVRARIVTHYEKEVRKKLFDKTLSATWSYLMQQKTGYLEKTILVDVEHGKYLMSYLTEMILLATSTLIYTVVAISISPEITLLTLILGATLFLAFKGLIYRTKKLAAEEEKTAKRGSRFINENVYGMKTVKTLSVRDAVQKKAAEYFERFRSLQVRRLLLSDLNSQATQLIGMLFILSIFYVSFEFTRNFNLAAFAVIIYLIQKMFTYVQSAQNKLHNIFTAAPYLANITHYEQELEKHHESDGNGKDFNFGKEIIFHNVSFGYTASQEVLSNISLAIHKGEMVGLVGPSGSGKTTLVDLLLRLFEPKTGTITIDGIKISTIKKKSWYAHVGYVSQDLFLINDSIEKNIKFYHQAVTDEDTIRAAKAAQIYDFIQSQPEKFKSEIGDRGLKLSGGQRQRVILARILARNPDILILDEATSALDNESEVLIQKAIESLKGKITVLAIAHRLSTIMNSDRLLVLENGKITESGKPQELLKDRSSYFYKVYNIRQDQSNI